MIRYCIVFIGLALLSGCANTQERTVDATMRKFDNGSFVEGQTDMDTIKRQLGSPAQQKSTNEGEIWIYTKTEEINPIIPAYDRGTNYSAEYEFDSKGILKSKSYRATGTTNPLLQ